MKKYLGVLVALLLSVLALAPVSAQAASSAADSSLSATKADTPDKSTATAASTEYAIKAGLPAKNGTLACTYASPVLRGQNGPLLLWDGPNGQLVYVTNYAQTIDSTDCDDGVRAATNWDCYSFGVRANCGAELVHSVEGDSIENTFTIYDCSNSPPESCFGSSGTDGKHTTYSAWRQVDDWSDGYRAHLSVINVTVLGYTSGSNHHSTSGWTG